MVMVQEITNLYLYGQNTTPSNKANDALISPEPSNGFGATVQVDKDAFMTTGAGRFAVGSQFDLREQP